MEFRILDNTKAVKAIVGDWNALAEKTPCWYFQKPDYFLNTFRAFGGEDVQPYVIVFQKDFELVAVFPWIKQKKKIFGFSYDRIGPIYHDHTYLNDVLIDENYSAQIASVFSAFLKTLPTKSFLFLPGLKVSAVWHKLVNSYGDTEFLTLPMGSSASIKPPFIDNKLAVRSGTLRNMRRLLRKAEAAGRVEFRFLRDSEIGEAEFSRFLDVEASGWKGERGTGSAIKLKTQLRDYYWQLICSDNQTVQCGFFYLDNVLIAANFCCVDEQKLSILKIAYNQNYSHLSPTQVLIFQTLNYVNGLEQEQQKTLEELSFITYSSWNDRWTDHNEPVQTIIFYPNTILNYAAKFGFYCRSLLLKVRNNDNAGTS